MTTRQQLVEKWAPVLNHEGSAPIKDNYRKEVTAVLLENQEREMRKQAEALFEAAPTNAAGSYPDAGGMAKFDPVLISLVRRAMPQLIAYDVAGVQPMTQPTGLIFAMKSRYGTMGGTEALFNEADTDFAGTGTHAGSNPVSGTFTTGTGLATSAAERLGQGGTGDGSFGQMAFSIEKTSVTAKTRALKPEYSIAAVDPNSFQPKIGFKTRYGLVANPFVDLDDGSGNVGDLTADANYYYRKVAITNLM